MHFARAIWKFLVGIKDAMVLLILVLFFVMLYGGLSIRPAPVKDGVLDLDLKGNVVEQPARAQWADIAGGARPQQLRLRDLIVALGRQRPTIGSRRLGSTSTASSAADRRRWATSRMQSGRSATRASR